MRLLRWASQVWTGVLLVTVLLSALLLGGRFVLPLLSEPPSLRATTPPDGASDITPRTRVVLQFSAPMNPRTVERTLQITPATLLTFIWDETYTTLTLSPTLGFQPETAYRITIPTAALNRQLRPPAAPITLGFRTAPAPSVVAVLPPEGSVDVPLTSPVAITFSRVMVAEDMLLQPLLLPELRFEPVLEGYVTWIDQHTALFRPTMPLRPGVRYQATLAPELADLDGGAIGRAVSWSFSTPGPRVLQVSPPDTARLVAPRAPLTLVLSQPLERAAIQASLEITPAIRGSFTMLTRPDNTQLVTYTPSVNWRPGTTYTVEFQAGGMPQAGDVPLGEGRRWNFTAAPQPALIGRFPGEGQLLPAGQEIRLIFSTPIDANLLRSTIQFTPTVENLRVQVDDTEVRISADLRASTAYTLTLPADLVDQNGVALGRDYRARFVSAAAGPALSLPEMEQHLLQYAPGQPPSVLLQRTNISSLLIDLYELDEATLVRTLGFSEADWSLFFPERYARPLRRSVTLPLSDPLNTPTEDRLALTADDGTALPPGIYYLRIRTPEGPRVDGILVLSDTRLALQVNETGGIIWATNAISGTARVGVPVALYQDDVLVMEGVTGADGLALFQPTTAGLPHTYTALVRGEQPGLASTGRVVAAFTSQTRYQLLLTTDKARYQPGEQLAIAGFIRQVVTQTLTIPPGGLQIGFSARNVESGRQVGMIQALPTASGVVSAELALAGDAPSGAYVLEAELAGQRTILPFTIGTIADPALRVRLNLLPGTTGASTAVVTVESPDQLPVAGATVSWTLTATPAQVPALQGYRFDPGAPTVAPASWSGAGITEANGELRLAISDMFLLERPLTYHIVAEITPLGQAPTTGEASTTRQPEVLAGLRLPSRVVSVQQVAPIEVIALDSAGRPLPEADVQVEVYRRNTQGDERVLSRTVRANSQGIGRLESQFAAGGEYRVRASISDTQGRQIVSEALLWVAEPGFTGWGSAALITDREQYQPGETAVILATVPYTRATALITIAHSDALTTTVQPFQAGVPLTVTVTAADAPGVRLGMLVYGAGSSEQPLFIQTTLPVVAPTEALSVTVASDGASYPPGTTATLAITTTNTAGQPVSADLIVLVTATHATPPESDGGAPAAIPQFVTSAGVLVEPPANLPSTMPATSTTGLLTRPAANGAHYWDTKQRTGANGALRLSVPLPPTPGSYQVLVWAAGERAFGRGRVLLAIEQPVSIQLEVPAFLRSGDLVDVAAQVENTGTTTQTVGARFSATGLELQPGGAPEQQLTLEPGTTMRVVWPVLVGSEPFATIDLAAQTTDGIRLADSVSRPILPASSGVISDGAALIDESYQQTIELGTPQPQGWGALEIDIAPSSQALAERIAQTLAAQPERSLLDQAGILLITASFSTTQPLAQETLAYLVAHQNSDGGWGWWPGNTSQPLVSAAVLEAIASAEQAGLDVPQRTKEQGLAALERLLARQTPPMALQAQMLYTLSLYGRADQAAIRTLITTPQTLDADTIAYLLLARTPAEARTDTAAQRRLVALALRQENRAHWAASDGLLQSDPATTALGVMALRHAGIETELQAAAIRGLAASRGLDGWSNGFISARAITVLYAAEAPGRQNAQYTVMLNQETVVQSTEAATQTQRLNMPLRELTATNILTITMRSGQVYASYRLLREASQPPLTTNGIGILREYLDPETGQPLDTATLQPGQRVQVRLTLVATTAYAFVRLNEYLPSGSIRGQQQEHPFDNVSQGNDNIRLARANLLPGIYEYSYELRLPQRGTLNVPPPIATLANGEVIAIGQAARLQIHSQ